MCDKERWPVLWLMTCVLATSLVYVDCYRPVMVLHGIMDKRGSMDFLADLIRQSHPDTNVTIINVLHGWRSLAPMWYQVQEFGAIARSIMANSPEGIHMIGYSQGGLVARGIIQSMNDHNVKTFISLSAPQAGQYGDKFLHLFFPTFLKSSAYKVFYTDLGQYTSIANYWNDPHQQKLYKQYSEFLVEINNERKTMSSANYYQNFLRLWRMVAIGGPDDGVITPWQSSHFGFFNDNNTLVEMRDRDIYVRDTFGLKTMDEENRLVLIEVPGVHHLHWHKNASVIHDYVLPWLD